MDPKREVLSPYDNSEGTVPELQHRARAFSPYEALMSTRPHEEPEKSQLELLALRDLLADVLDDLDWRDKRLIEAKVIEQRSYRSLEEELGFKKSHLQRRYRELTAELAERLKDHPLIKNHLGEMEEGQE